MRAIAVALVSSSILVLPTAAHAAPVATFDSFVEVTNPQYQYATGNVLWFNSITSGSTTVRINAIDAGAGMNRVDLPNLGSGWTLGGSDTTAPSPYAWNYNWSTGADSGVVNAIAWSNDGSSVSVPFEVRADSLPPGGGSLTLPTTVTNAMSIDVPFTYPTDAGSGLQSIQLQRRVATYSGKTCSAWSAWANIGAPNPVSPFTDSTLIDGQCYQYWMKVVDNVGNNLAHMQSGEVRIDRVAPTGTISATPLDPFVNEVSLSGTSADSGSGVANAVVTFDGPGANDGHLCTKGTAPETWTCPWRTQYRTPGMYNVVLTVTDFAGNVSIITRAVVVDPPPVVVDRSSGNTLTEGGASNTFDIVLGNQPTANVTISLTTNDQVTIDGSTRTFTPANWNVPQTVSVTAIDDAVDEDGPYTSHQGVIHLASASTDPAFNGVAIQDAGFGIDDNDVAGVDVSVGPPSPLAVDEAGPTSATFAVSLATEPTGTVAIDVVDAAGQVTATPASLTFTPANWNVPQVVTVTAIDDAVVEGAHADSITFTTTSVDGEYDTLTIPDVSVSVADNDSAGPSGSATATLTGFTEMTGAPFQHASGSTLWFNPTQSGSFTVNATATALPGLAFVTFPTLGAGWTPSADTVDMVLPYGATYAWSAGATAPGAKTIVATSTGGTTGSAPFTVAADSTPPAGPTIVAQSTVTRDTSVPVSGMAGTDSQSGIGTWRYQRRTAALASDACGPYGSWADLNGMNPAGPVSDASLPDGSCLQYQLVVTDNVGNASTATQAGELRVDRTAPLGTIDPVTAPLHGTVTLSGSAFDSTTRVRSVAVMVEDRYSICASAPLVNGRWSCEWSIGPSEVGPATIKITITDAAGQRSSVTQPVTVVAPPSPLGPREEDIDRTPPVVGLARMPLVSWDLGVKVKASAYDDRPGTLEIRIEQQSAGAASPRFTPWAPSFEESEIVPLEDRGETTCFRGIAIDEAGNKATSDPRCTTLPLDDMDLAATGNWNEVSSGAAWLGSARRSTKAGSALSIKVADANPVIVATRCAACGSIKVFHGRKVVGVYSLKAKKTLARQLIQLPTVANPTSAAFKIVTLNKKPVIIDAFVAAR